MRPGNEENSGPNQRTTARARILVASPRRMKSSVVWSYLYEQEDLINEVDEVDFVYLEPEATSGKRLIRRGGRFERWLGVGIDRTETMQPIQIDNDYDLFFCILLAPSDLKLLQAIKGFRERCRFKSCLLVEAWSCQIERYPQLLQPIADFDYVYLGSSQSVAAVRAAIDVPCTFLPPGIDAARFCPWPNSPKRVIDVYQMGRRAPATHNALLELAAQNGFFYMCNSIAKGECRDYRDHRLHLADLIQRSRYFIVNLAKADHADQTQGQEEFGLRFFEGAAAGAVMIGDCPKCTAFEEFFDWPDAVIQMDYGSTAISELIREFDAQPQRLAQIRRDGVVNALLRFDFVYCWEQILHHAGLPATPKLPARKQMLKKLVAGIPPA